MNIFINNVSVNGLGPIPSIKWDLKDINLIFGHNEKGKTFLVEYLLQSLFRNAQKTRSLTDSGQVVVSGITKNSIVFYPKSKEKIDDYLFGKDGEKTVDLSRLCVVKGGDLSFQPSEETAISKAVLKDYLSDQRTLDSILKGIPITIQESSWDEGQIIPKKQVGPIKELNVKTQLLNKIDELLHEVDLNYSQGEINKAKKELLIVEEIIKNQIQARNAFAFSLSEQIKEIQFAVEKIPEEELEKAKNLQTQIKIKNEQIRDVQDHLKMLEPKCVHYQWLKSALDECEKRPAVFSGRLGMPLAIFSISCVIASVVFSFQNYPYISLVLGLLSIVLIILTLTQFQSKLRNHSDTVEVNRIFLEYETKFGSKANSIAALKSSLDQINQIYVKYQTLSEQIEDHRNELSKSEKEILMKLELLSGRSIDLKETYGLIRELHNSRNKLLMECSKLKEELAGTQVEPEEYVSSQVETHFDRNVLRENEIRREDLILFITEERRTLEALKHRVCDITNDDFSSEWELLLDHLRIRREETSKERKQVKSVIGSGILIKEIISEIREKEDESITRALASQGILEPVRALTNNYDGVELDGDEIIAYNQFQRFPLSTLSTGAQEQVLLALRIGITSHILQDNKMFLILDDAFQHSDWSRREFLIDKMVALTKTGWQIIYFSMDDHIKLLFEERVKPVFRERYQFYELGN